MPNLVVRTLIRITLELLPFVAIIVIELWGADFERIYKNHIQRVEKNYGEILPDLDESGEVSEQEVMRHIAQLSSAEDNTVNYSYYSMIISSIIFYSKIYDIILIDIPISIESILLLLIALFWFTSIVLILYLQASAKEFFQKISPYKYYADPEDDRYNREFDLRIFGKKRMKRDQADVIIVNTIPIVLLILCNIALFCTRVLTMGG